MLLDLRSLTESTAASGTAYTLALSPGTYNVTGSTLGFKVAYRLTLDPGSYNLTGQSLNFSVGRKLTLDAGSYSSTGQSLGFQVGYKSTLSPGSYEYTGAPLGFVITTPTVVQIDSGAGSGKYKPTADDVIHWLRTLFPRKQAQSKPRKREREPVSVVRQYAKRVESVSHAELDRALSDARELDSLIQAYRQYLDAEQALQIQRAIDDEVGRKLAAYFAREAEQRARHAIVQWIKRQDDELAFLLIALEV